MQVVMRFKEEVFTPKQLTNELMYTPFCFFFFLYSYNFYSLFIVILFYFVPEQFLISFWFLYFETIKTR